MQDYDPDLDFEYKPQVAKAEIDPAKYQHYVDLRRTHQQFSLAIMAGVIGAAVGAMVWLGISMFTNIPVGWMAVGVGLIVGVMIRVAGQGIDRAFGIVGVVLTLAGCAGGTLLAGCWLLSIQTADAGFSDMVLALTPGLVVEIFRAMLSPMNYAYYGIGTVASYWFSIRRIKRVELQQLTVDPGVTNDADSRAA